MTEHSPLTCKMLFDFLGDYVDGTLPGAQREEFERHLARCPSCVAYVDGYRKTIELGRAACCGGAPGQAQPAKAPEGLLEAVKAALKKERGN